MTASIHNPIFTTTHSRLKKFSGDLIHDHCSLKFLQPQISHVRHPNDHCSLKFLQPQISHVRYPNVRRTDATLFPYNSRQRQKLPQSVFLPVVILKRCEIPHRLIHHV